MPQRVSRSVRKRPAKRAAGYTRLVGAIAEVNGRMVGRVATVANQALVLRNWMIGAYVVEYEQHGADRAKYGARLLETLAADLAAREIKGLGLRMLRDCRTFYSVYPQIRQTVIAEFDRLPDFREIRQSVIAESAVIDCEARPAATNELAPRSDAVASRAVRIRGTASPELPTPLTAEELLRFSWTHLLELLRLDDPWKRAFYENECLRGFWSVRQLQRQIESLLYERTGLSANKRAVVERARKQAPAQNIADLLRDPHILEFAE
ncbi:MAG: hypothetical protein RLZZ15_3532, partial [Verrucomicrobiota bacterium]